MKVINAFFRQVDIDHCGCMPRKRAKLKRIVRKRERALQRFAFARVLQQHLAELDVEKDDLFRRNEGIKTDIKRRTHA